MNYSLKRIDGPDEEPVTLHEAKMHLRVVTEEEDALIKDLISSAREYCEGFQNRAHVEQTFRLAFDSLPNFPVELPRPPLKSVEEINIKNRDGDLVEWDDASYCVDTDSEPGRIGLAPDGVFPAVDLYPYSAFQVTYKAGEDDVRDVSWRIKAAMKLLVAHWYANREASVTATVTYEIRHSVADLLRQERIVPT